MASSLVEAPSLLKCTLPEDIRPNPSEVTPMESIPTVDLAEETSQVAQQVARACSEYGFFQIVNHGVPDEIWSLAKATLAEFFEMSAEEKARYVTADRSKPVRLLNYRLKFEGHENVRMWSENLIHYWDPLEEDIMHNLPKNPPQYRELVIEYAKVIGELMDKLLSLMSLGLGLDKDSLKQRICHRRSLEGQANMYPPCPNPELTLGLAVHTDSQSAITVLTEFLGVSGLQVLKDGKWLSVHPIPKAFIVNLGDQTEVLTNGRYKSVHHRVVTSTRKRMSLALFYIPHEETEIGPIEQLIDEEHPQVYRSYKHREFRQEYAKQEGKRRRVKELFMLQGN